MPKPNCSKCGAVKTGGYVKDSHCGKCIEARRAQRRREKREAEGLPEYGTGRDPKCKVCRKEKEAGCLNGSLCKACRAAKARASYAKAKKDKGANPYPNKNPLCPCGQPKKNPARSYCTDCSTEKDRERRRELAESPDFRKKIRDDYNKRYAEDAVFRQKEDARIATKKAIRSGYLVRMPCEVCGEEKSEAHHDDYMRPLDVRWLCRTHHGEHHRMND